MTAQALRETDSPDESCTCSGGPKQSLRSVCAARFQTISIWTSWDTIAAVPTSWRVSHHAQDTWAGHLLPDSPNTASHPWKAAAFPVPNPRDAGPGTAERQLCAQQSPFQIHVQKPFRKSSRWAASWCLSDLGDCHRLSPGWHRKEGDSLRHALSLYHGVHSTGLQTVCGFVHSGSILGGGTVSCLLPLAGHRRSHGLCWCIEVLRSCFQLR